MIWSKTNSSSRCNADTLLHPLLGILAITSVVILLLILAFLLREAWPVLAADGWKTFLRNDGWYPQENRFGLQPMLWSSFAVMLGATLLAAPLGVASGIFDVFYAGPALQKISRLTLGLLAGIPSVVFGLWGLTVLVPLIAGYQPPGASLLAAILVVAIMIIPTIALTSAAALAAVPHSLIAGAAALGISRRGQILQVVLPAARSGIWGGILLALARALGETMAVLMVAGNVVQNPTGLFEPVRVLTANIALEMAYATGQHRAGLFASGLLLTMMVLILAGLSARTLAKNSHE